MKSGELESEVGMGNVERGKVTACMRDEYG